jgi:signal transduction histidine kinase
MSEHGDRAERRALDRLLKLQRVADAALAHLSLQDLLDELLERVREILATDTCAVLLLDERTDELVARAAKGIEEEVERGTRIAVGRGFAGRIAAERRTLAISDVDHSYVLNPILREKGIKSLLGAPLLARGRVLGVIHVGTLHHHAFGPDETELLELAADRAALAIDKALLHDELLRLDELRHRFVAVAAHELRTPAAAIFGAAKTLDHLGGKLSEEDTAELRRILVDQAERLATLVDQLLDVSRLDSHAVEIRPERIDVAARLDAIVSALALSAQITVETSADLEIDADPVAFDRIVGNLLTNALRHGAPPVFVRALRTDGHARVLVEDRGRGVTRDLRSRLFEQFARGRDSEGKPGSGLGLAIARSYAHAHGGELLYEDAEPNGARFQLVLPVDGRAHASRAASPP